MVNEIDINLGVFDLDQSNDLALEQISIKVAKSLSKADLPKAHGSIIPIGLRKEITARVRGTVVGLDYDDLRSNLDDLKNALEKTAEQKLTLDDDRFLMVQYQDFDYLYKTLRRFAEFSFTLVASNPFWISQILSSDTRSPASGVGYTIINNGNAPARIRITVKNNTGLSLADAIKLQNTTRGETCQYRGTLASGKSLIVNNRMDADDFLVTNDGTNDIKNFEGDLLNLSPGNNTIVLTSSGARTLKSNLNTGIPIYNADTRYAFTIRH